MKKLLSIMLTIAMLITILPVLPAVNVMAADATIAPSEYALISPNRGAMGVYTEDPTQFTDNGYGKTCYHSVKYLYVVDAGGDTGSSHHGILKFPMEEIYNEIKNGDKAVESIKLNLTVKGTAALSNKALYLFNANSEWSQSSVTMDEWRTANYVPKLSGEGPNYRLCHTDTANADVHATISVGTEYAPLSAIDITSIYKKAFPFGVESGTDTMSVLMTFISGGYGAIYVPTALNDDKTIQPSIEVTYKDVTPGTDIIVDGKAKVMISEDTAISVLNDGGSYGNVAFGEREEVRIQMKSGNTESGAALMKVSIADVMAALKEGEFIKNIEFVNYSHGAGSTRTVKFFVTDANWSEESITYNIWQNEARKPSFGASTYVLEDTNIPDLTYTQAFSHNYQGTPAEYKFDITKLYEIASQKSGFDGTLSFMYAFDTATGNTYQFMQTKECATESYRPYIIVTIGDESDSITETKADALGAYRVEASGSSAITGYGKAALLKSNQALLYVYDLPEVASGSFLDTYNAKFWSSHNGNNKPEDFNVNIYYPESDISDYTALTFEDISSSITPENPAAIVEANETENSSFESGGTTYTAKAFKADLTEYANKLISEGKDKLHLIIYSDYTTAALGKTTWNYTGTTPNSVSIMNTAPSIKLTSNRVVTEGAKLTVADAKLATNLTDASLACIKKNGVEVEGVEFVFNANAHKVQLKAPVMLEENVTYEFVIKAGAEDVFGNVLSEDIKVCEFTTKPVLEFLAVKFMDTIPMTADAFNNAESLTSVAKGNTISMASRIKKNVSGDVKMTFYTAVYDAAGELVQISVTPATLDDTYPENIFGTADLAIASNASTVRGFIWEADTLKPLYEMDAISVTNE